VGKLFIITALYSDGTRREFSSDICYEAAYKILNDSEWGKFANNIKSPRLVGVFL